MTHPAGAVTHSTFPFLLTLQNLSHGVSLDAAARSLRLCVAALLSVNFQAQLLRWLLKLQPPQRDPPLSTTLIVTHFGKKQGCDRRDLQTQLHRQAEWRQRKYYPGVKRLAFILESIFLTFRVVSSGYGLGSLCIGRKVGGFVESCKTCA